MCWLGYLILWSNKLKWDLLILILYRPGGSSGQFWRWNTDFGHIKFWAPQIKSATKWKADLKKPLAKSMKFKRVKTTDKWKKVFKNGPSETCGRQSSKNLKWYGLLKGYLRLKSITSQNVSSEAQVKNFFIS